MVLIVVLLMAILATINAEENDPESIYPDTLWCTLDKKNVPNGDGDQLGSLKYEDFCCRQRNRCPWVIPSDDCKYNNCNRESYTKFHCACDELFRRCLNYRPTEHTQNILYKFFVDKNVQCFN